MGVFLQSTEEASIKTLFLNPLTRQAATFVPTFWPSPTFSQRYSADIMSGLLRPPFLGNALAALRSNGFANRHLNGRTVVHGNDEG
jgi:hypothetical protein